MGDGGGALRAAATALAVTTTRASPAASTSCCSSRSLLVWGVVVLLALANLGIDITALVAGLGVGGIAIALAVQTVLGDLFASLSIALDKPFVIGDALKIDDVEGTVEQIGIKSTRLRSVSGEQIILSNNDLLKSRVRNLGRMSERRGQLRFTLA